MKSHISTFHEGKKDHLCDRCEKRYSRSCDLKHHIYTFHEGNKDFKCETCGSNEWCNVWEQCYGCMNKASEQQVEHIAYQKEDKNDRINERLRK